MRLQTLASMSEVEVPFEALHDQINSAVDVIVQLTRHADGARRITEIAILESHGRDPYRITTVCRFDAQPMAADGRIHGRFQYFPLPRRVADRLYLANQPVPQAYGVAVRRRTARRPPRQLTAPPSADRPPAHPDRRERADEPLLPHARRHPARRGAGGPGAALLRGGPGPAPSPHRPAHQPGQPSAATGRRRPFQGVDRRLRGTTLGRRIERKLAATGLDLTPGEFFVYMLAGVAAPVADRRRRSSPRSSARWRASPGCGAPTPSSTGSARNASSASSTSCPNCPASSPTPPRPASRCVPPSPWRPRRWRPRRARNWAGSPTGSPSGESLDDALGELADRLPSRELVVLVTTLVLSNRAGGTVVSSLRNLTTTLEERKETRREVRTTLAQVTVTAYAVPGFGIGRAADAERGDAGRAGPDDGRLARPGRRSLVAFALYALGFFLVRRLSRIDV